MCCLSEGTGEACCSPGGEGVTLEIRKLKVELPLNDRVETGPVQFNDDWPGFFIRGDNVFALIQTIGRYLMNHNDVWAKAELRAWAQMLGECNINQSMAKEMQREREH